MPIRSARKIVPVFPLMLLILCFFSCGKNDDVLLYGINSSGVMYTGFDVCFNNVSSGATSYLWEFGDGKTSTESAPCHSYATAGTYTVKLTINNNAGQIRQAGVEIKQSPAFTHLIGGMKTWHHTRALTMSGGYDTTYFLPDTSFAIRVIDPLTIAIDTEVLSYIYVVPYNDTVFHYMKSFENNSMHITQENLIFKHGITDDIQFTIYDQVSAAGTTSETFKYP